MKKLNKISDFIDKIVFGFSSAIILFIFVANVLQVIVRKTGGTLSWSDEVCRHLVLILVAWGAAVSVRSGNFIRITVLLDRLKPKAARMVDAVEMCISMFVMILVTDSTRRSALNAGDQSLGILTNVKLAWIYWICYAGLILYCFNNFLYIINLFDKDSTKWDFEKENAELIAELRIQEDEEVKKS